MAGLLGLGSQQAQASFPKLVEYEVVRNPTNSVAWHVARVPSSEPEISKLVQEEIWMEQPSLQGYFEELFPTHPHQKDPGGERSGKGRLGPSQLVRM